MKHSLKLTAASLLLATCASASTLLLPSPSGQSALAAWVPTNAQIVDGALEYTGQWTAYTNVAASYVSGSGSVSYNFTSNLSPTPGTTSGGFYTGNAMNTSYGVSATNYSGPSFSQITLQLAMNSTVGNDTAANLNALLRIGGSTFGYQDATFNSNPNFQPAGFNSDPTNRYYGHHGVLTLVTITWDLEALNFVGDLSDFNIDWTLTSSHSALYDVQISTNAVPEPATVAAILGALALGFVALRRNRR